jgi:hypothetical protein
MSVPPQVEAFEAEDEGGHNGKLAICIVFATFHAIARKFVDEDCKGFVRH